jgi:hypothetical protein
VSQPSGFLLIPKFSYIYSVQGLALVHHIHLHDTGDLTCFNLEFKSFYLHFGHPGNRLQAGIPSLDILTNLSTSFSSRVHSVLLYGCETWSLTLREERKLMIFENSNLRRIFGPKRDVNGEWRRLHSEEFHSLYS